LSFFPLPDASVAADLTKERVEQGACNPLIGTRNLGLITPSPGIEAQETGRITHFHRSGKSSLSSLRLGFRIIPIQRTRTRGCLRLTRLCRRRTTMRRRLTSGVTLSSLGRRHWRVKNCWSTNTLQWAVICWLTSWSLWEPGSRTWTIVSSLRLGLLRRAACSGCSTSARSSPSITCAGSLGGCSSCPLKTGTGLPPRRWK
jgi:hypothetical protein